MAEQKAATKQRDLLTEDDACDAIEDILTQWALDNGTAAKADVVLGSARTLLKSKA